jgi:hypothetical protein
MTEARVSVSWAVRMLIAGLAFVGFGCWSLYDGKVKYPKVEETFQQYQQAGQMEEWVAYAGKQGWKQEWQTDPDTGAVHVYSPWDIRTQFIMAAICLPVGFGILIRLVFTLPKKVGADESALYATSGERIPHDAITDIDRRKWARKGIAVVHYELNGKPGKATIDDWIFKGAAKVLDEVDLHVRPEISGLEEEPANDSSADLADADEPPSERA